MLTLEDFACGATHFLDDDGRDQTAKIYVSIRLDQLLVTAQIDTGSPWCLFDAAICEALELLTAEEILSPTDRSRFSIPLSTRIGTVYGRLARCPLVLEAEAGDDLEVQATILVCPEWTGPNFIGYSGCLERIRFAIDPGENLMYFGPAAS